MFREKTLGFVATMSSPVIQNEVKLALWINDHQLFQEPDEGVAVILSIQDLLDNLAIPFMERCQVIPCPWPLILPSQALPRAVATSTRAFSAARDQVAGLVEYVPTSEGW